MTSDNLDDFSVEQPPIRPAFLLTLCILSFVGIGWGIISNLWMYAFVQSTGIGRWSDDLARYASMGVTIAVISNLICLVGVILMMSLRKAGFFIYVGGQLLAICMKLYVENKMYDFHSELGIMNIVIFVILFPALFITLYAVNFKALVK